MEPDGPDHPDVQKFCLEPPKKSCLHSSGDGGPSALAAAEAFLQAVYEGPLSRAGTTFELSCRKLGVLLQEEEAADMGEQLVRIDSHHSARAQAAVRRGSARGSARGGAGSAHVSTTPRLGFASSSSAHSGLSREPSQKQ